MYLGLIGSVIGLVVSLYIRIQKKKKVKLICPREGSCEKVVHSTHATTLGIPNELLGLGYYGLTGTIYALTLIYPALFSGTVMWVLVMVTCLGAIFSIYLIALQGLVIRAWCAWCLGSAFATFLLVLSLFQKESADFFQILANQRLAWVIIHNIGFVLGLGGATITDVFFFRFLKDNLISEEEKSTMDTLTNVIWVGLAILIISGIMLYLPKQLILNDSPKFILKTIVVIVVTINGLLLNMYVAPKMRSFSFAQTEPARHFRRLAFMLGGISLSSWYTAFILGSLRTIKISLWTGLITYFGLLVLVVIGSQIFEYLASKQKIQTI